MRPPQRIYLELRNKLIITQCSLNISVQRALLFVTAVNEYVLI